ncbi:hypothetical protein YC2023_060029 [Brassica napus]
MKQTRRRNNMPRRRRGGDTGGRRRNNAIRNSLNQFVEQDVCRSEIENLCGVTLMFFALEMNRGLSSCPSTC